MIQNKTISRIMLILISLVLIVIVWKTGTGANQQWSDTLTFSQKTETVLQFICCALSIIVLLTAWLKLPFSNYIQYTWGLSFVSMSVISSFVWGPPMILPPIVFGAISFGIVYGVLYTIRKYSINIRLLKP